MTAFAMHTKNGRRYLECVSFARCFAFEYPKVIEVASMNGGR